MRGGCDREREPFSVTNHANANTSSRNNGVAWAHITDLVKKVSTRLRVLALVTRGTQESASLDLYGTFYDVTVLARSQNE